MLGGSSNSSALAMSVAPGVRLEGCTVVVTGANAGIGLETTRELYCRGAYVVMAVRSVARGEVAKATLEAEGAGSAGDKKSLGKLEVMELDLASQASVRAFARDFIATSDRLDILINNAGLVLNERSETEDGMETTFGVNHLGPFLLTLLLLDKLKASAPSRIVNVSSRAERSAVMKWDDLQLTEGYSAFSAYSQSKLANVLFTRHLSNVLKDTKVTTYVLHPGVVNTNLINKMPVYWRWLVAPFRLFFSSSEQGAQTTLYCALETGLANVSGRYYEKCKEVEPSAAARSDADAARLWEVSCRLVGWEQQ